MIDRDKLYQEIGRRVKDARTNRTPKLKQGELAKLLGVERTSISNIEQGAQRATLHFIYLLAEKLNIPLGKLLPSPDNDLIHSSGEITELAKVKLGRVTRTVSTRMKSLIEKM
jgi:transcriptional regulator with XRE-family HTH domain